MACPGGCPPGGRGGQNATFNIPGRAPAGGYPPGEEWRSRFQNPRAQRGARSPPPAEQFPQGAGMLSPMPGDWQQNFGAIKRQPPRSPNVNETYTVRGPNETYTVPSPNQTYTVRGPNETYTVPSPNRTYTVPNPNQTYTVPNPNQTYTVPSPNQTYTVPSPNQTYTVPNPNQTYTVDDRNRTYTVPDPNLTYTVNGPMSGREELAENVMDDIGEGDLWNEASAMSLHDYVEGGDESYEGLDDVEPDFYESPMGSGIADESFPFLNVSDETPPFDFAGGCPCDDTDGGNSADARAAEISALAEAPSNISVYDAEELNLTTAPRTADWDIPRNRIWQNISSSLDESEQQEEDSYADFVGGLQNTRRDFIESSRY